MSDVRNSLMCLKIVVTRNKTSAMRKRKIIDDPVSKKKCFVTKSQI